jgi:prepilin-type processing-associated H-X9-DG protein
VLRCPDDHDGDTSASSYIYLKPKRPFDKILADEILAYESLTHHEIGGNVLFGDGHVEWFDKSGFEEVVADAQCLSLWLDGAPSAR